MDNNTVTITPTKFKNPPQQYSDSESIESEYEEVNASIQCDLTKVLKRTVASQITTFTSTASTQVNFVGNLLQNSLYCADKPLALQNTTVEKRVRTKSNTTGGKLGSKASKTLGSNETPKETSINGTQQRPPTSSQTNPETAPHDTGIPNNFPYNQPRRHANYSGHNNNEEFNYQKRFPYYYNRPFYQNRFNNSYSYNEIPTTNTRYRRGGGASRRRFIQRRMWGDKRYLY